MQPKTQRKRTPKTPRTPAQDVLDKAVETLVKEGIFTGESGFHELIHEVSKSFLQAALRGELTEHLNEEKEAVAELEESVQRIGGSGLFPRADCAEALERVRRIRNVLAEYCAAEIPSR